MSENVYVETKSVINRTKTTHKIKIHDNFDFSKCYDSFETNRKTWLYVLPVI